MSSLTSYLAQKGAVNPARLQKALLNQAINGGSTSLSLLEVEAISGEQLVEMTGRFFHLSTVSLSDCLSADPDVVRSLPRTRCEDLGLASVGREEGGLLVACVEPPAGTALGLLERDAPGKLTFVIASPVAVALTLALRHGVDLDPRIAALVRRDGPLEPEGLDESVCADLEALMDEASAGAPSGGTEEVEEEEDDDDDWDDDWDDEDDEEPPEGERDSIVGKYIIVNRIGARKRRPSMQNVRPAGLEEPGEEEVKRQPDGMGAEVTFTDGSLKASKETRPSRPSSVPPPPRPKTPARAMPESVPAAILKEVVEEYLEDGYRPPPRVPRSRSAPEPARPAKKQADVKVTRTVNVTPQPSEPVKVDRAEEPARRKPRRKVETKTLHGMAVLDELGSAPDGAVQGYSVEVSEIMSLSDVLAEIETSDGAGGITDVVHRYALQFFDFVLMMRYRRGSFELAGVSSRGWAWPLDRLPTRIMGYDQLPESVRKVGQPHLGPVDEDGKIAEVIRAVGRSLPANGMLMPISLKGRTIVMIYGDNGERSTAFDEINDLFHATWVATNTLLGLLEERRR
ncbi:MAG: hypothetical protein JRG91_00535 [Deltaproteobacteria bacterium]|nr:hypothetical protein [Deltaproteobacteria bacterium]